jgi:hypothetical protein
MSDTLAAPSGFGNASVTVNLGPVILEVDASHTVIGLEKFGEDIVNDTDTMAQIATAMQASVRDTIRSGAFQADLPETIERRKYAKSGPYYSRGPVSGTAPLFASGQMAENIRARSRPGYAAAKRGKDDWWAFLQDRGKGRLDQRQFMVITAEMENYALTLWEERQIKKPLEEFGS